MFMEAYSSADHHYQPEWEDDSEGSCQTLLFNCFPIDFLVNYLLPLQLGSLSTPRRTELFLTARGL